MKPWTHMNRSPATPARPTCPHRRLGRLLARELPHGLTLGASTLRPWASASFVGARHIFPCSVERSDRDALCRDLHARFADANWRLPGHIVADVAVEPADEVGALRIEILTVED